MRHLLAVGHQKIKEYWQGLFVWTLSLTEALQILKKISMDLTFYNSEEEFSVDVLLSDNRLILGVPASCGVRRG